MKFVTYRGGGDRVGVLEDGKIHGMAPEVRLLDLLGDDGERLRAAGEAALADPREVFDAAGADLASPLPAPPSVRDFLSFEQHLQGVSPAIGREPVTPPLWFEAPTFYFTNPHNAFGDGDDIPLSPGSGMFDCELEVAAVIGRAGADLTPEEAEKHIAGYLIMNDWTARDLQWHELPMGLGPAKGKDTATTLGPALVTADELEPRRSGTSFDLAMRLEINGVVIGTDNLSSMYWSFGELAAYASRGTWIRPGDVLGSGTCGMGCLAEVWGRNGFDAHPPLRPGDTVKLSVDGLGELTNRVVAGPPPIPLRPR